MGYAIYRKGMCLFLKWDSPFSEKASAILGTYALSLYNLLGYEECIAIMLFIFVV